MANDAHGAWCYVDEIANKMLVDPFDGLEAAMIDNSLHMQLLSGENTAVAADLMGINGNCARCHATPCQSAGPATAQVLLSSAMQTVYALH